MFTLQLSKGLANQYVLHRLQQETTSKWLNYFMLKTHATRRKTTGVTNMLKSDIHLPLASTHRKCRLAFIRHIHLNETRQANLPKPAFNTPSTFEKDLFHMGAKCILNIIRMISGDSTHDDWVLVAIYRESCKGFKRHFVSTYDVCAFVNVWRV
jgi:hypothetical protein